MSWNYSANTPSFVTADGKIVLCPTPISFALPQGVVNVPPSLARNLAGNWPSQAWKSGFYGKSNSAPVPGGGAGSSSGVGGVPPMGPPPSYASNNPAENWAGIPIARPIAGEVPPMGQPSSYASEKAVPYGIPPMAPPTTGGVLPPTSRTMFYSWSDAVQYGVPDLGFVFTDGGYEVPDNGLGDVHKTPPIARGVHSFWKQPAPTEKGVKQKEPRKTKVATSGSDGKKRDVAKLLEGFTVVEEVRRGGKSIGHKDKYYIHIETGKKLRSVEEVERFKLTGKVKKSKPLTNTIISGTGDKGQPPQEPVQLPNQQLASDSVDGGTENAFGEIPNYYKSYL